MGNTIIENYDAKEKTINRVFENLRALSETNGTNINFSLYYLRFKEVSDEVKELREEKSNNIPYDIYYEQLEQLEKDINDKYGPIYTLCLYSQKVHGILSCFSEDNYDELLSSSRSLLDLLIDIGPTDEVRGFYEKGIRALYEAIINEKIIEKNDILTYVLGKNNFSVRESLGECIKDDLAKLDSNVLLKLRIDFSNQGLGYDFLNEDVIKAITNNHFSKKINDYQDRKKSAMAYILETADDLLNEEKGIKDNQKNIKKSIKNQRVKYTKAMVKFASLLSVPVIVMSVGGYLWSKAGKSVKNTIRTYDGKTYNETKEPEIVYQYNDTPYELIITKYGPWREKLSGDGYIRDTVSVTYTDKDIRSVKDISIDETIKVVSKKTESTETKSVLDEWDSMTEPEITIRETIMDKNDTRTNPWAVISGEIPIVLIILLITFGIDITGCDENYYDKLFSLLKDLKRERTALKKLLSTKVTRKQIRIDREVINDEIVDFKNEYDSKIEKFGDLLDDASSEEIAKVKRYIKEI